MAKADLSGFELSRVIIAGGGTGGHVCPALAIGEVLKEKGHEVLFVGTRHGLETKMVPAAGYPLLLLPGGQLNVSGLKKWVTFFKMPLSLLMAFFLLLKWRPQYVLGVGGYASGPFVLIASFFTRTGLWEPNAFPGMANRILSRFVKDRFLVFPEAAEKMNLKDYNQVGVPVRKEIEMLTPDSPEDLGKDGLFRVFVFGGSQGARAINNAVLEMLQLNPAGLEKWEIFLQVGRNDIQRLAPLFDDLNLRNFHYSEYVENMAEKYQWADLVICRGGISSITELAAAGKPAVIIPLPSAADNHQQKNAESRQAGGAVEMLLQKGLSGQTLFQTIHSLQENPDKLKEMSDSSRRFHVKNAAASVVDRILSKI